MHISVSKILQFSVLALVFTFSVISCKKDNSDVIKEEVIDKVDTNMKITVSGRTIQYYDAYATYCDKNGKVFFNVSNNQALLDSALVSTDFKVDDFLINYGKQGTDVSTLGGASFNENLGGINIVSVVFDPAATITITAANDQYVTGSMTGSFQLLNGTQAPYTVQFTAEVIKVSPWCN
jgi:hypothetical protein